MQGATSDMRAPPPATAAPPMAYHRRSLRRHLICLLCTTVRSLSETPTTVVHARACPSRGLASLHVHVACTCTLHARVCGGGTACRRFPAVNIIAAAA
eukprot:2751670-Prymnesium_polylepis.1